MRTTRRSYHRAAAAPLDRGAIGDRFTDDFEAKHAAHNRLAEAKDAALSAITAYAKEHGCSSSRPTAALPGDPEIRLLWQRFDRLGAC